jgi:sulfiredoxin
VGLACPLHKRVCLPAFAGAPALALALPCGGGLAVDASARCLSQSERVGHCVQVPGRVAVAGSSSARPRCVRMAEERVSGSGSDGSDRRAGPRGAVVRDIPLRDIARPLAGTRTNDSAKVERLMESIREEGQKMPIDVLDVEGRYYGFNGCHRFEACQRLGRETIKCRIYKATREILRRQMM